MLKGGIRGLSTLLPHTLDLTSLPGVVGTCSSHSKPTDFPYCFNFTQAHAKATVDFKRKFALLALVLHFVLGRGLRLGTSAIERHPYVICQRKGYQGTLKVMSCSIKKKCIPVWGFSGP